MGPEVAKPMKQTPMSEV
jgi:hypothetical protein